MAPLLVRLIWLVRKNGAPMPLAFEIDPTADNLPPVRRSFMHAYMFKDQEDHYWDPDKWLDNWKKRQPK